MIMTEAEKAALVERCRKHLEWRKRLGFRGVVENEMAAIYEIALDSLTAKPEVYEAEINGVMSSVTKSHYDDCKKYGVKTRTLYTAQPASAIVLPDEAAANDMLKCMYSGRALSSAMEAIKWHAGEIKRLNGMEVSDGE